MTQTCAAKPTSSRLRKGGARKGCKFAGAKRRGPTCVRFDAGIQKRVSAAAAQRGFAQQNDCVGAGHDAGTGAFDARAAMVFVPGEFAGIESQPARVSTEQQCANGVNVMLDVCAVAGR